MIFKNEKNINDNTIVSINHKNKKFGILFNKKIYDIIKKLDYNWLINDKSIIYTKKENSDIYLHDIVMYINSKLNKKKIINKPIIHINRNYFDNRIENLDYDKTDKINKKNLKKKKRTIDLSSYGINTNDLPTFLWFNKSDNHHGDRFFIKIGNISWKSTSSSKVSLNYKLEESKKFLRNLKIKNKDIFNKYSMNGDFTDFAINLLNEYNEICDKFKLTKFNVSKYINNTDKFLEENTSMLNKFEKNLLKINNFNDKININNLYKKFIKN